MKTMERKFELRNHIDIYGPDCSGPHRWVNEVIESIEKDELLVFDATDENALRPEFDGQGVQLLHKHATLPISIKEWLAVGCQSIGWLKADDNKDLLGCYKNNFYEVICCPGKCQPVEGPAAFTGEIQIRSKPELIENENKFKCVVAHEFVHVFDYMRFLVPAFMNWASFWGNVLDEGCCAEDLAINSQDTTFFIDDYGCKNELSGMEVYWPSQAEKWFNALRQETKKAKRAKDGRCGSPGVKPFGFFPGESETVERIKQLYNDKPGEDQLSYPDIARVLNREERPTRSGAKWSTNTVKAILERLNILK